MSARDPKEVFVLLLSNARNHTERSIKAFETIGQAAENPDVKEALEARKYIAEGNLRTLDKCFEMIGEKPVQLSGKLHDVFMEDFKRELAEIQSPQARHLYALAKAIHLAHLRFAEYAALIAAADATENYGVGVLLESVLADKMAFLERDRRLVRHLVTTRVKERMAERLAA